MDWDAEAVSVADAIDDVGADIVIITTEAFTVNIRNDSVAEDTTAYPVKALISDYSKREIDGTLVQVGDKKLLVSASDLPRIDKEEKVHVEYDDLTWNVIRINPTMPGGIPVMYEIQVRN